MQKKLRFPHEVLVLGSSDLRRTPSLEDPRIITNTDCMKAIFVKIQYDMKTINLNLQ